MIWLLLGLVALVVLGTGAARASGLDLTSGGGGYTPQTVLFAQAIARAEGTVDANGMLTNSVGAAQNNPGDLEDANGNLRTYATPEDGWNALYNQASVMLYGPSRIYNPNMTLASAAYLYTGADNQSSWARTVAGVLGVSITTTLEQIGGMALVS